MKPILFNTEMVKAILDRRKSVTRRVVKPQPTIYGFLETYWNWSGVKSPYCPGEILYVRETWSLDENSNYVYRTNYGVTEDDSFPPSMFKWRPSIHMPKEAARLFLRVTDVRVERLRDITDEDLIKEIGVDRSNTFMAHETLCWIDHMDEDRIEPLFVKFWKLWDSTIKKTDLLLYSWNANPWVWVIEFERISKEEARGGSTDE